MSQLSNTVLIIGGTGAQGLPVIKELTSDSKYTIRVLTRDTTSPSALLLASLPNVTLFRGPTYDETTLHAAFAGITHAFINTNGFAIGEKAELYWGIRIFEIARASGVHHFVWSSLDYALKVGKYDPKFRTGHYDGKGKVAEWISAQPLEPMRWTVLTSGPYVEMLWEPLMAPRLDAEDGETLVFAAPLGEGAVPMICLEDLGGYARWVFDRPDRSGGMDLKVATEHVGWEDLVKTFTEITGRKAVYKDVTLDEYFGMGMFADGNGKVGHSADFADETLQTFRSNFSGFWNLWKYSGGNKGVIRRDYVLLDEILPQRIKKLGEWIRRSGYNGERGSTLKDISDGSMSRAIMAQAQVAAKAAAEGETS